MQSRRDKFAVITSCFAPPSRLKNILFFSLISISQRSLINFNFFKLILDDENSLRKSTMKRNHRHSVAVTNRIKSTNESPT